MVDDDLVPGTNVLRLIKLLRGEVTQMKKYIMNQVIGCWLISVVPCNKEQYQPGSCLTMIRKVFKTLWDCCIRIQNKDLKSCKDSYHDYLVRVWSYMADKESDFGRRPMKATVEHDDQWKIRNSAKPPMDPEGNYRDLMMMLLYAVGSDLKCRNGEVSLIVLFFCFLFYFTV